MHVKATLAPGRSGTRPLAQQYGDPPAGVRYRYDKAGQKRIKTVEPIVDQPDWIPGVIVPVDRPVALKIGFGEAELRQQVKNAGGYWNPQQKAWILSYRNVLQMGLEQRIIDE